MAQQYRSNKSTNSTGKGRSGKTPMLQSDNFVESMRGIGRGTINTLTDDFIKETPKDFIRQLLGLERPPINASGEIQLGQSIEINQVIESQTEENKSLQAQLVHERKSRQDNEQYTTRQTQELKLQLKALQGETEKIAKSTIQLSQEIKIATIQATVEPGVYHIVFFEKLLSFIKAFRKKINQANLWIQSANKKASKRRTFWGQVSKSGAQRLLSSEDYSQRSAG